MYFVDRDMWDAQPPRNGAFDKLAAWRVKGVVIHHSGVRDGPKGTAAVHAFERHHLSKGWDGIGYNWLVDETGTVFEGRGWGSRGAGTKGWNSRSISVCFTGWGGKRPHANVLESIKALVAEAESHFKRGMWVSTHRRKGSTTCPGDWLGTWVEGGMTEVKAPTDVDWVVIVQYFKDLRKQVEGSPLRRRARGFPVRLVQARLNDRGFDAGTVDGIFGRRTAKAVREFQGSQGFLKVTGVVNGDTFGALFLQ